MTDSTTIDRSAFTGSARALRTAGLKPPGEYLFELIGAKPDVYSGTNNSTGEPFTIHRIKTTLRALKVGVYAPGSDNPNKAYFDHEETLDTPLTFFKDINIHSKALEALRNMYKAVTGRLPEGDSVDYLAMAEELRGQKFWGSTFWVEDEDNGTVREMVKNTFRSIAQGPPASVYVPQDRD